VFSTGAFCVIRLYCPDGGGATTGLRLENLSGAYGNELTVVIGRLSMPGKTDAFRWTEATGMEGIVPAA
jgi:hypothetical protein